MLLLFCCLNLLFMVGLPRYMIGWREFMIGLARYMIGWREFMIGLPWYMIGRVQFMVAPQIKRRHLFFFIALNGFHAVR